MESEITPEKEEAIAKIEAMATALLKRRDAVIIARAADGCEARMREDQETHDAGLTSGKSAYTSVDYVAGKVRPKQGDNQGSQLVVNVVRGRTEIVSGRLISAALPTDDRVFELECTPDPELDEQLMDTRPTPEAGDPMSNPDGSVATVADIARFQRDEAQKRMSGMQTRIDDQLTECNAHTEYMKGIESSARTGTMVIKGPYMMPVIETKFVEVKDQTGSVWEQESEEKLKPALKSVRPEDCYPAEGWDGEDVTKLSEHWEKGSITSSELRTLRGLKNSLYIVEQIDKVLASSPKATTLSIQDGKQVVTNTPQASDTHETWERHGDVGKEALEAMGRTVKNTDKFQRAVVLFANDIPIKATLYPADNMPIIYNYWQYSKIAGSPFGSGIPRAGRWPQLVIQGAFRGMADLANNISGGHLAVAMGQLDSTPEKRGSLTVWPIKSDVDISKVMAYFQTQGNPQIFMQMIEMALRFFDLETTTPTAFQGDKTTMPETLGATNILVDSGNAATEHRLSWLEKKIFIPVLKGFYLQNMLDPNCPNEIKGDYNVKVSGVKRLQNRDLEAKMIENLMAMFQDPEVSAENSKSKLVEKIFKMYRLDVRKPEADIKADKEKMAQNPPPPDPALQVAQINAESRAKEAEISHQGDMKELELKGQLAAMQQEFDKWAKEMDIYREQIKAQADLQKSTDQNKVKLAVDGEKINLQRDLSANKGGQALTPPVEPGPKAETGRAYEQ